MKKELSENINLSKNYFLILFGIFLLSFFCVSFVSAEMLVVNSANLSTIVSIEVGASATASLNENNVTLIANEHEANWADSSEARITLGANEIETILGLTEDLTLGDLEAITFEQYVTAGYPAHIDILLDVDKDEVFDSKKDLETGVLASGNDDVLVVEFAYNSLTHYYRGSPYTVGGDLNNWINTFNDMNYITDSSNAWLYSACPGAPGSSDFLIDTLSNWKLGKTRDYQCYPSSVGDGETINSSTKVYAIQIEVDAWVANSQVEIRNITINNNQYYISIQDAINSAQAGDVISVGAGIYEEDLVIDKGVTLQGNNAIIKGVANVNITLWPLAVPNIDIREDNVALYGFTIKGPDYAPGYYSSGIVIEGSNVEIYNNAFETTPGNDASGDEISQAIQTYSNASIPGVDISGLYIHDNIFTSLVNGITGYEGIYVNPDDGINPIRIINNTFTGDLVRAITSLRSNTTVENNQIITDFGPGFPGGYQGINVGGGTNIKIIHNIIKGFSSGINVASPASGIVINLNILSNNTYGIKNTDSNQLDATKNYWGTSNGTEIATLVSGNVSYTPWYSDTNFSAITTPVFKNSTDNTTKITLPTNTSLNVETEIGTVEVEIPEGTEIVGNLNWTGALNIPSIKNISSVNSGAIDRLESIDSVIEVGFPDVSLTFSKAVRLLIPGMGTKSAGYSIDGTDFTTIPVCTNEQKIEPNNLSEGGNCYTSSGSDMIIWTKHFTNFIAYTQTANPAPSSSPSSSGSGGSRYVPTVPDVNEPVVNDEDVNIAIGPDEEIDESSIDEEGESIINKGRSWITGAVTGATERLNATKTDYIRLASVVGLILILYLFFVFQGGIPGTNYFGRAAVFHKRAQRAHLKGQYEKANNLYNKSYLLREKGEGRSFE